MKQLKHTHLSTLMTHLLIPIKESEQGYEYAINRRLDIDELVRLGAGVSPEGTFFNNKDLSNRLCIPMYANKRLMNIDCRDLTGKAIKCLYLPHRSTDFLWNTDGLDTTAPLYIMEGLMDVLVLKGFSNKTCTFGSSLKTDQIMRLREFKHLVVIPDNDPAGEVFVRDVVRACPESRVVVKPVPLQFKDLGEASRF